MKEGIAGLLHDKTRPSRIPPLGPEVAARVVALTLADPPVETTHWTADLMARASGIVFNSDGGNLLAGIEIGKTIRLKSFATAVLDGLRCASACAFAWLGGSPRFMERGANWLPCGLH